MKLIILLAFCVSMFAAEGSEVASVKDLYARSINCGALPFIVDAHAFKEQGGETETLAILNVRPVDGFSDKSMHGKTPDERRAIATALIKAVDEVPSK